VTELRESRIARTRRSLSPPLEVRTQTPDPHAARLLCVRHGETEHNAAGLICSHTAAAALTPVGREQAREVAERLAETPLDAVYSSPLTRAVETAEVLTTTAHGLDLRICDKLRELSAGELDGRGDEEAYSILNEALDGWSHGDLSLRIGSKGEAGRDVVKRCEEAFLEIGHNHRGDTVAVVSHGGILQVAVPWICSNLQPEYGYRRHIPNCAFVEVLCSDELECSTWDGAVPISSSS
jgi:broad specificity phosphatase PhoE